VCSQLSGATKSLIESVLAQNYPRLELILADDTGAASRLISAALTARGSGRNEIALRSISERSNDRGASRNVAAIQARGKYLLFIQENAVILEPHCIAAFVTAAVQGKADIVTGVPLLSLHASNPSTKQEGRLGYFPIGACKELGAFENCFGKGVMLVDLEAFTRCPGFETRGDPQSEDWLFLASAVLSGLRLEVIPEPVFRYQVEEPAKINRPSPVGNYRRILDAYSEQKIETIKHIVEIMLSVDRDHNEGLREALAGVGSQAREIALRVSSLFEPNQEEALQGVVEYLVERYRVQDALDFALYNGTPFLTAAIGSATRITETLQE
jgi:glycosyltransferase involved in cell wall biosynthesis